MSIISEKNYFYDNFVELGGGVGDVCVWRRDGECVEVGLR